MKKTFIIIMLILALVITLMPFCAAAAERADIVVRGGVVVTMDGAARVIENGAVAIRADRVVGVGRADEISRQFAATRTVDASGKVIMPGLINTHTHIPMVLFRGIADDLVLMDWLNKYIFPAEKNNVDEEFVRWGTRLGLLEMLRGGTTTYVDMYYFEDAIADETSRAGMRAVLGETVIDFPAPDNKTWDEALAYADRFVQKWRGHPLITP
ncbi:MAG TPA: amidohydrolase family protein, partial [Blastocatellia bacterium]|nr:amidohydrolase family protein [Blastocatellia bacterium]